MLLYSSKSPSHSWGSQCPSQYPSPSKPHLTLPPWTTGTSWCRHQARWHSTIWLPCPYQYNKNSGFSFCSCYLLCPERLVWHKRDVSWTNSSCWLLVLWSCETWLCFCSTWSQQTRFPWAVHRTIMPFFFHSSQQDPLSMCIGLLVFNYQ